MGDVFNALSNLIPFGYIVAGFLFGACVMAILTIGGSAMTALEIVMWGWLACLAIWAALTLAL